MCPPRGAARAQRGSVSRNLTAHSNPSAMARTLFGVAFALFFASALAAECASCQSMRIHRHPHKHTASPGTLPVLGADRARRGPFAAPNRATAGQAPSGAPEAWCSSTEGC